MAPTGFGREDYDSLYNATVYVSSLPRSFISRKSCELMKEMEAESKAERPAGLAMAIIAATQGRRVNIDDLTWPCSHRHGLAKVQNLDTFQAVAKHIYKDRCLAFGREEKGLRMIMSNQGYTEQMIKDYLQRGLLPRLTRETFMCYHLSSTRHL